MRDERSRSRPGRKPCRGWREGRRGPPAGTRFPEAIEAFSPARVRAKPGPGRSLVRAGASAKFRGETGSEARRGCPGPGKTKALDDFLGGDSEETPAYAGRLLQTAAMVLSRPGPSTSLAIDDLPERGPLQAPGPGVPHRWLGELYEKKFEDPDHPLHGALRKGTWEPRRLRSPWSGRRSGSGRDFKKQMADDAVLRSRRTASTTPEDERKAQEPPCEGAGAAQEIPNKSEGREDLRAAGSRPTVHTKYVQGQAFQAAAGRPVAGVQEEGCSKNDPGAASRRPVCPAPPAIPPQEEAAQISARKRSASAPKAPLSAAGKGRLQRPPRRRLRFKNPGTAIPWRWFPSRFSDRKPGPTADLTKKNRRLSDYYATASQAARFKTRRQTRKPGCRWEWIATASIAKISKNAWPARRPAGPALRFIVAAAIAPRGHPALAPPRRRPLGRQGRSTTFWSPEEASGGYPRPRVHASPGLCGQVRTTKKSRPSPTPASWAPAIFRQASRPPALRGMPDPAGAWTLRRRSSIPPCPCRSVSTRTCSPRGSASR